MGETGCDIWGKRGRVGELKKTCTPLPAAGEEPTAPHGDPPPRRLTPRSLEWTPWRWSSRPRHQYHSQSPAQSPAQSPRVLSGLFHAMLDTIAYQLEEALRRLRELNSGAETRAHDVGYTKSLLRVAGSTLELLGALTSAPPLASLLALDPPLATRLAALAIQFVSSLVGPRSLQALLSRTPNYFPPPTPPPTPCVRRSSSHISAILFF